MIESLATRATQQCRHCSTKLSIEFLDLGFAPPSNSYLTADKLHEPELHYPLRLFVCENCWLVQTEDFAHPSELFSPDYAYFSSVSSSWQKHAAEYVNMIVERLQLDPSSHVLEIASNDGYLLKNFVTLGIPCLGVEPTHATAAEARKLGVETIAEFFGEKFSKKLRQSKPGADLVIGNNVFAHVPDILDFAKGIAVALNENGVVTLEFPHLLRLIEGRQFDTVYHEHFSYLSLASVGNIFSSAGLRIFDAEELPTHGGSLRVYGCLKSASHNESVAVARILEEESSKGLQTVSAYRGFQEKADAIKFELLRFLLDAKRDGKTVIGYGAAAKGSTLLNFSGIKDDLIAAVCDAAPSKQGKYLPGSHIYISDPSIIDDVRPDYLLVFPWNLIEEVQSKCSNIRDWNSKFVTAIPEIRIF